MGMIQNQSWIRWFPWDMMLMYWGNQKKPTIQRWVSVESMYWWLGIGISLFLQSNQSGNAQFFCYANWSVLGPSSTWGCLFYEQKHTPYSDVVANDGGGRGLRGWGGWVCSQISWRVHSPVERFRWPFGSVLGLIWLSSDSGWSEWRRIWRFWWWAILGLWSLCSLDQSRYELGVLKVKRVGWRSKRRNPDGPCLFFFFTKWYVIEREVLREEVTFSGFRFSLLYYCLGFFLKKQKSLLLYLKIHWKLLTI